MKDKALFINSNSRVLVTGGFGFVGQHLVKRLLQIGVSVVVIDDLSTGIRTSLEEHPKLKIYIASILDEDILKIAANGCDLIFHLASVVGMKLVTKDPAYSYKLSVEGTNLIFDVAGDIPVVLFSSSAVYGMGNNVKANEKYDISLSDALLYDGGVKGYAVGKFEMEKMGLERSKKGLPTMILRPFNLVGYGQLGNYGMVLPRFIDNAMNNKPLTIYGDGEQSRCFSDIGTGIDVIISAVKNTNSWELSKNIINIGCSESTKIKNLAVLVRKIVNEDALIVHIPYEQLYNGKKDVTNRFMCNIHVSGLIGSTKWPLIEEIVNAIYNKKLMTRQSRKVNDDLAVL